MSDISKIYQRMQQIQNFGKNMRKTYTPEMVQQYQNYVANQMQQIKKSQESKMINEQNSLNDNTIPTENKITTKGEDVYLESDNDITKIAKTITAIAKKYNVSEDLIRAVIKQESGFNKNAVSHAGAEGLMQLMPQTAKELDVTNSFDIYQNIDGGVKYLRQLLSKYDNDLEKALAAYNAGPHRVDAVNGVPKINETMNYVNQIKKSVLSGINFDPYNNDN